jgi:hypothetical protein
MSFFAISLFFFFQILFGVLFASSSFELAFDSNKNIMSAKTSLSKVMLFLNLESNIDIFSDEGRKPENDLRGEVSFKGVHFRYPTRVNSSVGIQLICNARLKL